MTIHYLNCFTCNARLPRRWRTGTLCLLVETAQGPVLIDTGPGRDDYAHPPWILRLFQLFARLPMDVNETAVQQVARMGYAAEDVRQIVLTHMHFDHCGGLGDFPNATVHVHEREYQAFRGIPHQLTDLAYVRRHVAHAARLVLYKEQGESWYGLPAIRLPFQREMWLVPLYGHTRGHCGVAIRMDVGWHFHVADAAPIALEEYAPAWLVNVVLGPHTDRLRAFAAAHPEVRITTGHMWLDFFRNAIVQVF
ncbi:MAG: MBL fold metallo-hydrolase [Anaerolinea sp.]|nr:MBL fold metallo-hydrolase [Anaerolinea sp.]